MVFHILFFNLLSILANSSFLEFKNITYLDQNTRPRIEIQQISPEQLKRFRTVGVKGGKKEFSINKSDKKHPVLRVSNGSKNLSLLALKNNIAIDSGTKVLRRKRYSIQKERILKDLAISRENIQDIKATDFNIRFEPPEGVSEDELNSVEKVFYSFQKRTFHNYIKSFITIFNNLKLAKPLLKKTIQDESHKLTGRVVFDKEGNIISIKILRWSVNDDIQELFEKTLSEIRKLPNPPHALINTSEEFTIYYQLNINN